MTAPSPPSPVTTGGGIQQPPFLTLGLYALFGICPLLFFTDLTRNPYYTQIALLNILICVCWLLWIIQAWKQGQWIWVHSRLDLCLWLLMGVCALSWGWSFFQHPNFVKPIYSEGSRAAIFLIVNTYLVYAAAVRCQDRESSKRIIFISYAVTVIASIYGILQYFGTELIWPQNLNPYGSRPVSTFGNPNFMSSYLVVVLPVAMADFIFKITGLSRFPLFVVIISAVGALIATLTRSSWAGGLIAVLFVGLAVVNSREAWPRLRKPVLILVAALGVMVFAWPKSSSAAYSQTVLGRLTEVKQIATGTYGAVTQRFLIWLSAWKMVEDHPFIGKGWGTFELFYPYYQGPQLTKKQFFYYRTHANNSHNEILEYWSQIGTIGLGFLIFLWVVFFRQGLAIAQRLPNPSKGLEWALMGGVAGMLVDNLLNVSVHFAVPALLFWWWVGGAMALDPAGTRIRTYSLQPVWRKALLVGAAIMLMCFSVRSFMMWQAEINFFAGFKLSKQGVDLVRAAKFLEKAKWWHQSEVNNNYELANIYARIGRRDDALRMYQESLDANSGYDEIYFNRATMYMQLGQDDQAIRYYRIVLAINPLSREAYNALAGIYMKDIPRYGTDAEAVYMKAAEMFSGDKDVWNNLGYLQVQRRRFSEAYDSYKKALEIDPHFELAKRNLAYVTNQLSKSR